MLTVTADDLIVTLTALELTNNDLISLTMGQNLGSDGHTGNVRLTNRCSRSILRHEQYLIKGYRITFFTFQRRHAHFHALFGLFLKPCDVDDCEHKAVRVYRAYK